MVDDKSAEYVARCYKNVFGSGEGQVVLKDLMNAHFIQAPLPLDKLEYAEGQRNVVLRIIAILAKDFGVKDG